MKTPIRIIEVGPRDGLQNEPTIVSTSEKLRFIAALIDAGCTDIEVASFVNPKLVPAMADAGDVLAGLPPDSKRVFWSLVPNEKGYVRAREAGARAIAVFASASESFSQKNIGRSIKDSLDEYQRVVDAAFEDGCGVRGYVSCVTHCPYEGKIAPDAVLAVAKRLFAMGCEEVSLGETLGRAEPSDIRALLDVLSIPSLPAEKLAGHFHNTNRRAIESVAAALEYGLRSFDSSAAGLGGCPFAPGAAGNLATETLVRFLHAHGYETGIDPEKIAEAGRQIREVLAGDDLSGRE